MKRVKVLRLLIYDGEVEAIQKTFSSNGVKVSHITPRMSIHSHVIFQGRTWSLRSKFLLFLLSIMLYKSYDKEII